MTAVPAGADSDKVFNNFSEVTLSSIFFFKHRTSHSNSSTLPQFVRALGLLPPILINKAGAAKQLSNLGVPSQVHAALCKLKDLLNVSATFPDSTPSIFKQKRQDL